MTKARLTACSPLLRSQLVRPTTISTQPFCCRPLSMSSGLIRPRPPVSSDRATARHISASAILTRQYRRFGDPISRLPVPSRDSSPPTALSPFIDLVRSRYPRLTSRPPLIVFVILGAGGIYYVVHLERVPESGRLRFMAVDAATEESMTRASLNQTLNQYRAHVLPARHPTTQFVTSVAKRIVEASNLEGDWHCYVIDDPTRNAFVIGSHIFVFTGILAVTKDRQGLAAVLGHEIAHKIARHSSERLSSMKVLFALSILLNSLGLDVGLTRILLNLGMTLPNSRTAESEADYIGLQLSTKACFDPRAAKGLWERMASIDGASNVDFLSTHPSSSRRAVKVEGWAKEILPTRPYNCGPLSENLDQFRTASQTRWR